MPVSPIPILVVDSNPERLVSLRQILVGSSQPKFEIVEATNVSSAVALLANGGVSMVLSGLRFSDSKGLDAIVRYRQVIEDVPLIVLLENDEKDVVLGAAQSLSDDCIFYEDLTPDRLLATISISMDRRRMAESLCIQKNGISSDGLDYKALLNRLDHAVFLVTSNDGELLFFNEVAKSWFGDSIDSVLADVFDYGVLSGDELEVEIVLTNLHVTNAEMRSIGIYWNEQECCLVSLRNIVKRKRAETAYKSAQRRLELALKASNVGFWSWDLREQQLQFSERWKAQIGYSRNEFMDTLSAYQEAIHPEDRPESVIEFRRFLKGEPKVLEQEFRMQHANGSYRNILSRAEIFPDEEGKLALVLGTHVDITDRRVVDSSSAPLLRQDAQASSSNEVGLVQSRIERYASRVAADADNICSHFRRDSKIVRNIREFENTARRISRLSEWLSAASEGEHTPGGTVDLTKLVVENLSKFEELLPQSSELNLSESNISIIDSMCESSLRLLLAEAISIVGDYVHEEYRSKVTLNLGDSSDKHLEIEYMGVSVCGDDLRSLSRTAGVTASAVGRGDRSVLILRFNTQNSEASVPTLRVVEKPLLALLAEDEGVLRLAIQSMLESIGYEVVLAENGEMAVDKFMERIDEYDVAFVDLHMPLIDGEGVVTSIRSKNKTLSVVKMSGDDEMSVSEAFGFDDSHSCFLAKPFGIAEMKHAIASLKSSANLGV